MRCGGRLAGRQAGALRFVTVVFCDLVGSTELVQRFDPQVWHGLLGGYFDTVGRAVTTHGGRLEKFIGDAVVGVFGAEMPGEDDGLHAVEAALTALELMARHNQDSGGRRGVRLSLRFGVASGRVVTADRDSSFAVGAVMNRAARLQAAAAPDSVVVDLRTWLLVRDRIRCEPTAAVVAKGFERPLQAWTLSRGRATAAPATRFVNQVALIDAVQARIGQAMRHDGLTVIALRGQMGSGKTRILSELVARFDADRGARADVDGRGVRAGARSPAALPAPAVVRLDGHLGDAGRALWRLEQIHRDLGGRLAGAAAPSTRELQWAIRRRLAALSRIRPLLLVMDDYPLAPGAVRDLLSFPAERTEPITGPIAALIAGRQLAAAGQRADAADQVADSTDPADTPPRGAADAAGVADIVFTVPALGDEHTRELLGSLAADVEPHAAGRAASLERLVHVAGGNPLFIEQLAAMAVESADDALPPSAEAALGARIDRLGRSARRLLACLGAGESASETIDPVAACGFDERTAAAAFDELGACGLDENTTAAQVAYAHLVLSERAELHHAIALQLLRRAETDTALLDAAASHAVRSREYRHALDPGGAEDLAAASFAVRCLTDAARQAVVRGESPAAATACGRARELAGPEPDGRAALAIAVVESYALAASGRAAEALRCIEHIRPLMGERTCPDPASAAHLKLTETAIVGRIAPDTRETVRACRDPGLTARLHSWEGVQIAQGGDYPRAQRYLNTAYRALRRSSSVPGTADIYANYSLFLAYGDTPTAEALRLVGILREEVADTPILNAVLACPDAMLTHQAGDRVRAFGMLEEARAVFADFQHVRAEASAWEFTSELAELSGDLAAARESVARARTLYDRAGAELKALLCDARAYVLDPTGRAPDVHLLREHASWVARTVGWQAAALQQGASRGGSGPLVRAVDEIAAVRGAGAALTALPGCLRIAKRVGADDEAERVRTLLAQAEARRCPQPAPPNEATRPCGAAVAHTGPDS